MRIRQRRKLTKIGEIVSIGIPAFCFYQVFDYCRYHSTGFYPVPFLLIGMITFAMFYRID